MRTPKIKPFKTTKTFIALALVLLMANGAVAKNSNHEESGKQDHQGGNGDRASLRSIGHAPDRGLVISAQTSNGIAQKSGSSAQITAQINIVGLSPHQIRELGDLREALRKAGIELQATFPDGATDVTANIVVDRNLGISYVTPLLKSNDANVFTLTATRVSEEAKELSRIQGKIDVRIARFSAVLADLKAHGGSPAKIAELSVLITHLQAISARITAKLAASREILAQEKFPLQVDNIVAGPSLNSTLMGGFRVLLESTIGSAIEGEKTTFNATIINLFRAENDNGGEDGDNVRQFIAKYFWQGVLLNTPAPQSIPRGGSVSFSFTTEKLSPGSAQDQNTFTTELFASTHTDRGADEGEDEDFHRRENRIAHLSLQEPVARDDVPPRFLAGSSFESQLACAQSMNPVLVNALDDFGLIDRDAFQGRVSGRLASGAAVYFDVTSSLIFTTPDQGQNYSITGDLNSLLQDGGRYTVSISGADLAGNAMLPNPLTSTFLINKTPPHINFASTDGLLTNKPAFVLSGSIIDLCATNVTISQNGNQIFKTTGMTFDVPATLVEGVNVFTVVAQDAAGLSSTGLLTVTLDTIPPAITIIAPSPNTVVAKGALYQVAGTSNEPLSKISASGVTLDVSTSGVTFQGLISTNQNLSGQVKIPVVATDMAGNSKSSDFTITISNGPPTVVTPLATSSVVNTPALQIPIAVGSNVNTTITISNNGVPVFQGAPTPPVTLLQNGTPAADIKVPANSTTGPLSLDILSTIGSPAGSSLVSVSQPALGTAVVNADGTVTYTPDPTKKYRVVRAARSPNGLRPDANVNLNVLHIKNFVLLSSQATNLGLGGVSGANYPYLYDVLHDKLIRESFTFDGSVPNDKTFESSLSGDGRLFAFQSRASNILPNDVSTTYEIYVKDRNTGTIKRVSVAPDGITPGNGQSDFGLLSLAGNIVVFGSKATNLVPNDTNSVTDIFARNLANNSTYRVSVASDGTQADQASPTDIDVSANGQNIVFTSYAKNLVPNSTNAGVLDVYVHNLTTGQTKRASIASDGTQGNGDSFIDLISDDGRYVYFSSFASNLVPNDTNNAMDFFRHDFLTGQTTRLSVLTDGSQIPSGGATNEVSADQRLIGFQDLPSNLGLPGDNNVHCYLKDLNANSFIQIDVDATGASSNAPCNGFAISDDSTFVLISTTATNMVTSGNTSSSVQDAILVSRSDRFNYTITDASGKVSTGTVLIEAPFTAQSTPPPQVTSTIALNPGVNTIVITATDSTGAQTVVVNTVTLDTRPPKFLNLFPLPNSTITTDNVAASGTADKPLSSARVTSSALGIDQYLQLSADQRSFSGTIAGLSNGPLPLHFTIIDLAGNMSAADLNLQVNVRPPAAPPVLSINLQDHAIVSVPTVQLNVQVTSSTPSFSSTVTLNGNVVGQSSNASYSVPLALQIGKNTLQVSAVDANGLTAPSIVLTDLTYDAPLSLGSVSNMTGLFSPSANLPASLSQTFLDKVSTLQSAAAIVTNRSDTFQCNGGLSVTPPSDPTSALTATDLFTAVTPDVAALAAKLGSADNMYFFVRDQIKFLTRFGLAQTPSQTLRSGYGTAADKSALLIALFRAKGIPARFIAGEALVAESVLKNLYGVDSSNDLAWAQLQTLRGFYEKTYLPVFDPAQMVYYEGGKRAWHVPHVWVQAQIAISPNTLQWIEMDPSYVLQDYVINSPLIEAQIGVNLPGYFFSPDATGAYVKSWTIADDLLNRINGALRTTYGSSADFTAVGLQSIGLSVLNSYSVIPAGSMSVIAPCIKTIADLLPSDYTFTNFIRVDVASAPVLQATLPLAATSDHMLVLSHTSGLLSDTASTGAQSGNLILSDSNGTSIASAAINTVVNFNVYHAIQEPLRYGGAVEARYTPGGVTGGVQVIEHTVAPTNQIDLDDQIKNVVSLKDGVATNQQLMTAMLKLTAVDALLHGANNERIIDPIRGVRRMAEHLLTVTTNVGQVVGGLNTSLGIGPSDASLDWDMAGVLYSMQGNNAAFASYTNITNAKGEYVVANSAAEHQVWQELFGAKAYSTVNLLQTAAQNAQTVPVDLIRGDALTPSNSAGIYSRLQPEMQKQIPVLDQFLAESPYLYSVTDVTTANSGIGVSMPWGGVAYAIIPSTPSGRAAAFITSAASSSALLGAFVTYPLTETCYYGTRPTAPFDGYCRVHSASSQIQIISANDVVTYFNEYYMTWTITMGGYEAPGPAAASSMTCWCHSLTGKCFCIYCLNPNGVNVNTYTQCTTSYANGPQAATPPAGYSFPGQPVTDPTAANPAIVSVEGQGPNGTPENSQNTVGSCAIGSPVNIASGLMWHQLTDFSVKGRTPETDLTFTRTYLTTPGIAGQDLGSSWRHNWEMKIVQLPTVGMPNPAGPDVAWIDEAGGAWTFSRAADGTFTSAPGQFARLTLLSDHYEVRKKNGTKINFYLGAPSIPDGTLKSIVEPHGESIVFAYDSSHRLASATTALAGTITIGRDASGRITSLTRARDSFTYTFTYNPDGTLASSSNFDGNTTTYTYNNTQVGTKAFGLLSSITDPLNRKTTFTYYDNGQAFEQTEPGNGYRVFEYSAPGAPQKFTRVKDIDGVTTEFRFDSQDRLIATIYPDGSQTQNQWNSSSLLSASIDELGYSTQFQYDGQGNIATLTQPDGAQTGAGYDYNFNKPVVITPPVGSQITFALNTQGDVVRVNASDAQGLISLIYGVDTFGNILSTYNGRTTYSNSTNSNGLYTSIFDSHNPESRNYDARGRVITRTFASGRILTYSWDNHDRLVRRDDNAGPSIINSWDIMGRLLSRTITDGITNQVTQFGYDDRDRVTSITDALNRKTLVFYDKPAVGCDVIDKPVKIVDSKGRESDFTFDSRQRLKYSMDANFNVTRFEYNARGDQTAITDPSGNRTQYYFDSNRRLTKRIRPSALTDSSGLTSATTETTQYKYDLGSRITRIEALSSSGGATQVIELTYDPLNQVTRKVLKTENPSTGAVLQTQDDSNYTYIRQIDATRLITANNGVAHLGFGYEPAPPFALSSFSIAATDPSNTLGLMQKSFTITRDATGELSKLTDNSSATVLNATHDAAARLNQIASSYFPGQGLSTTIGSDAFGRKKSVTHSTGMSGSYSFDNLNRINSITWSGLDGIQSQNFSEAITYNALSDQIDSITRADLGTFNFQHDAVDQLLSVAFSGTASLPNELVNRSWQYDPAGSRTQDSTAGTSSVIANAAVQNNLYSINRDPDGHRNITKKTNLQTGETEIFGYRGDDLPTNYQNTTNGVQSQTFYDALGRKAAKLISTNGTTFTQTYLYLGDEHKVLFAKSGTGDLKLYLDGQGIDEHFGELSATGVQAYLTDHLGSVLNGQAAGGVPAFSPWGEVLGQPIMLSPNTEALSYGFTGRPLEADTRKQENRRRTYDASLAAFMQVDPLDTLISGDPHGIRYAMNNPLRFVDPSGLAACDYNVVTHTMTCVSSTGDVYKSSKFVSGTGGLAQNNPAYNNVPFIGPIQPGTYDIGPQIPGTTRRPLAPVANSSSLDPIRPGFQTHGCGNPSSCSQGCVASPNIAGFNNFISNDPAPSTLVVH